MTLNEDKKYLYRYKGPVFKFGKCVDNIVAETYAKSDKQALNQIAYQYKIRNKYAPYALVTLLPECLKKESQWK